MKPGGKRKGGEKARTVSLLFLALTMILSGCSHYGTGAGSGSETKDLPSSETERDISDGSEDAAYAWISDRIENGGLFTFGYAGTGFDVWEKSIEADITNEKAAWKLTYRSPEGIILRCKAEYRR